MPDEWIDQAKIKEALGKFFDKNRGSLDVFGQTVNQTFEAFVFASTIAWHQENGWAVEFRHPKSYGLEGQVRQSRSVRLKFSTRGAPNNYSYVVCRKGTKEVHIRHQLRVATRAHCPGMKFPANVCLDVAVIEASDLATFASDDFVPNEKLISFGEAKHMSAFAELVANFVGLVHEMQPERLNERRANRARARKKLAPFLYVSGFLFTTAQGIEETIRRRGFDLEIFNRTKQLAEACSLPEKKKPKPAVPPARSPRSTPVNEDADLPY